MANILTLRNLRKITGAFEINDDAQCVVVSTAQGEVQVIDFANILAICNNTVFYYTSSALSAIDSIEVENGMRKYTLVDGTTVIPFDATAVGTTFIKDVCQTAEEPAATAEEESESGTEAEEEEIDDTPVAKAVSGRRGRKPKAEHVVEEPVPAEENEDDELELNDEDDEDEIESNDEVESDEGDAADEIESDDEADDDELELDEDDEDEEEELPAKKQPARKTKSAPAEEEDDDELELDEDGDDGFEFEDDADDDHDDESSSDDGDDEEDELEFEDESDDNEDEEEEAVEEDDDDDFDI